ncbi:rod shape-determining protein MreC [Anaplasmataceae bacterium AB001_6]|nr:rod shape-determining protein MreC [Anaplasmataceae bacterium AB001_6]
MKKFYIGSKFILFDFLVFGFTKYLVFIRYLSFLFIAIFFVYNDINCNYAINSIRIYTQKIIIVSVNYVTDPFYIVTNRIRKSVFLLLNDYLTHSNSEVQKTYHDHGKDLLIENLIEENNLLRQSMHFINNYSIKNNFEYVSTKSIGGVENDIAHYIMIPVGKKNGITNNSVVIDSKGLVGKVIRVNDNISQVLCITDVNFRTSAFFRNSRNSSLVSGNGKDGLIISYLKETDKTIIPNEEVETLGIYKDVPSEIVIGRVIDDKYIEPFTNCQDSEILYVMKDITF